MLTTKITRAIGGNSDLLTSQSFVFQGATADSEQVMLIVLLSARGEDVFTKIRNTALDCEAHFFSSDLAITQRLHETSDYLQSQLTDFPQNTVLLAALKDEVLYVISNGPSEVLLLRETKTRHLVRPNDNQLISGYLQPGDRVLFLSSRFQADIPPIESPTENIITEQHSAQRTEPKIWDDYFIQRLLLSDQEIIEQEIETYLAGLPHPEPIGVVLLSTQTQEELDEPLPSFETETSSYQPHFEPSYPPTKANMISIPKIPWIKFRRFLYRLIFPLSFKKLALLAAVVLLLIAFSAFNLYQFSRNKLLNQQFAQALSESEKNLQQAQMNKDSNPQMAKQYLNQAKQSFAQASQIRQNDQSLEPLNTQLVAAQQLIFKSTPLNDWQIFLSLDLIKPNFSTERMSKSLNRILLLDKAQKSLVYIDIETKNNQLIAGETQIGNAFLSSINGDYAFSFSDDKGLIRHDLNTKKPLTVSTPDKEWGRIADIYSFSSNVYALDANNNQIWKYVPTQNSYSEKQIYLTDNQGLDFSTAKQLFIDYSVWVLKENAEIYRFTAGNKDFYSIGGLDQPITDIKSLYVPEEEDRVFLLDPANKRIVVTKKNGEFILQYTSDKLATATDLIYDEETKILYLLEGGKIWQTTLP